jgi:hypothetical protein
VENLKRNVQGYEGEINDKRINLHAQKNTKESPQPRRKDRE